MLRLRLVFSWCSKNVISSSAIVASRLELLLRELGRDPTDTR